MQDINKILKIKKEKIINEIFALYKNLSLLH
jgi:hypothetical protein